MKLKLNKKKMKALSADNTNLPANMTPNVAGAGALTPACETTNPSGFGRTHCIEFSCHQGKEFTCGPTL
ncbi:hypothetical protein CWB99_19790 [Pseudoalteromonas rubra]|uniref:Uncharacterized protein n=1 Tax=Pseudoalteromonas rubra TaxID=43658 RepID=A0A5S3WIQ0_9GAMM|nr:hypothetical protein [Pseudoalteromonas rubra]TMP26001.1 hypothetical protein CWB99_19790 [Pseudoalteromonas rubra]TMP28438.1 hypothetical protein CWC00_21265 [Pseudoalteromonas rubra]